VPIEGSQSTNRRERIAQAVVTIAVMLLVGCYYWWAVRAAGDRIEWDRDLRGYYNYLGQAFASGQLHLPITPSSELLALKNPWDPKQNDPYRMHDMVLFGGKYYLYHGAGPAVLLFAPWRLITGHDLPENVAVAVLCIAGFLFYSAALMRVLDQCGNRVRPGLLALLLLALGVGQSVPYLCSRVGVYEVAIAGGFCSVAAGIYFLTRGLTSSRSSYSLGAAGLMFGLALACRPHLGLVGFICFAALLIYMGLMREERIHWRDAAWYLVAFAASGLMVAVYNYVRFGDPFEFGLRYLLAGDEAQQRVRLSAANLLPGLYYMLICPPDFSPVFPWVRLALRLPFDASHYPLPRGYFLEPVAGALFVAPILVAIAFRVSLSPLLKSLWWTVVLSSIAILLFVALTGFTTQRYLVDFVPLGVFAALIKLSRQPGHRLMRAVTLALMGWGVIVNLALGITGPFDDILANRPASYVRMAGWFSPVDRHRPMMNPSIAVTMDVAFAEHQSGFREPFVTIGGQGARHSVYVEHRGSDVALVSHSEHNLAPDAAAVIAAKPSRIRLTYESSDRVLTMAVNGIIAIRQPLPRMVTAPSQVIIGGNGLPGFIGEKFTGRIVVIEKTVAPRTSEEPLMGR
jgi:hypothetical protein